MKICHVNSYYCGTSLYSLLINSLKKLGIYNRVYCFLNKKSKINVEIEEFVKIEYTYPYIFRLFFPLKHLKTYRCFRNYLNTNKSVDILHAHSLFSNGYIAYKANKEFGIPYIVAVRNTDMNVFFKYMLFLRPMAREILKNSAKIIFVSEGYRQKCISKYIINENQKKILYSKSEVIVNGINKMFLSNKRCKNRLNESINLMYVGEISKNKNLSTSIKACEILIKNGHKVNFTVIGEIKNSKLNKILNKNFITYHTKKKQEELMDFYRKSDVFLMPSKYETFGLVYAEAMSQGLPVIYTRGQGFDKQFEEGVVGFSVKYNDAKQIAVRILDIYKNYNEISKNAYELSSKFDWDAISETYQKIYEDII